MGCEKKTQKDKKHKSPFLDFYYRKKTQKHKKHRVLLSSHEKQKTKTQKDMSTLIIPLLLKTQKHKKHIDSSKENICSCTEKHKNTKNT